MKFFKGRPVNLDESDKSAELVSDEGQMDEKSESPTSVSNLDELEASDKPVIDEGQKEGRSEIHKGGNSSS